MKLAVPDLISNSYFPAAAAVELGFFEREGLDVSLELIFPVSKAYEALRDGAVDFVGGSAHSALAAFPEWDGAKLLCAQGQGMYWFLVMHSDLKPKRGDVSVVKGRSIGAAPWVDMGLRGLLTASGIDLERDQSAHRAGAGCDGRGREFRRHCGKGAGRAQDRRLLGERHGDRGGGAPWRRHGRHRRAARRRTERVLQLHDGVDRHDRSADCRTARCGGGSGSRDRQDACGVARGS